MIVRQFANAFDSLLPVWRITLAAAEPGQRHQLGPGPMGKFSQQPPKRNHLLGMGEWRGVGVREIVRRQSLSQAAAYRVLRGVW